MSRNLNHASSAPLDCDWRGYHPRAAIPVVMLAAFVSASIMVGRWRLDDPSDFTDRAIALAFYVMTLAVWPALLTALVYKMVTYTYRLAGHAVFVDWGFRNLPEPPVLLRELQSVEVEASWFAERCGVGRVNLKVGGERVVSLKGVRHPETFVAAILEASAKLKLATASP